MWPWKDFCIYSVCLINRLRPVNHYSYILWPMFCLKDHTYISEPPCLKPVFYSIDTGECFSVTMACLYLFCIIYFYELFYIFWFASQSSLLIVAFFWCNRHQILKNTSKRKSGKIPWLQIYNGVCFWLPWTVTDLTQSCDLSLLCLLEHMMKRMSKQW